MRCWQTWLVLGILWFANSPAAQAQSLLERLGQAFTQETPSPTPPASEAPDLTLPDVSVPDVSVPEVTAPGASEDRVPESLPARRSAPRSATGRPTLGVTVDPVTDDLVRQLRLPVRSGAMISAIVPGSPAAQAGLPLNAVIVALDGRRIDSPADLVAAIRAAPTDREIELSYYERDRLFRKRVHLLGTSVTQIAPVAPAPVRREPQPLRSGTSLEQQLGGGGQRPVLGRVGQLLDGLVAPATGTAPLARPAESSETALLRQQVTLLQQELEALRARLVAVERQLQRPSNE